MCICPSEGKLDDLAFSQSKQQNFPFQLNWYLGQLEAREDVICQNYTCGASLQTSEDCLHHDRNCGYLWQCEFCSVVYKTENSVRLHDCQKGADSSSEVTHMDEVAHEASDCSAAALKRLNDEHHSVKVDFLVLGCTIFMVVVSARGTVSAFPTFKL